MIRREPNSAILDVVAFMRQRLWGRLASPNKLLLVVLLIGLTPLACGSDSAGPEVMQGGLTPMDFPLDFAPDGLSFAYAHVAMAGESTGIYVKALHPDSLPRFLFAYSPESADPSELKFAPDGHTLAIVRNGFEDIELVDLGTGLHKRLTYTNGNAKGPDWNPQGDFLVYERPFKAYGQPDTSAGLFIVAADASYDRPILQGTKPTYGGWAKWSPDSTRICYGYGSPTHIFVVGPDGSGLVDLTPSDNRMNEEPIWLTDSIILYQSYDASRKRRRTRSIVLPGTQISDWTPDVRPFGMPSIVSRTSRVFVFMGPDPTGKFVVLYSQHVDDKIGASRTQVTFVPP